VFAHQARVAQHNLGHAGGHHLEEAAARAMVERHIEHQRMVHIERRRRRGWSGPRLPTCSSSRRGWASRHRQGVTPLEPSWLWPLLIEECLPGEEGQERAQSGAVELGGLDLDSGAEQSCAAEESNSLPLAFSCLSLAFSSLSCSVSSLSRFILCS
jgi:hypothetical protein